MRPGPILTAAAITGAVIALIIVAVVCDTDWEERELERCLAGDNYLGSFAQDRLPSSPANRAYLASECPGEVKEAKFMGFFLMPLFGGTVGFAIAFFSGEALGWDKGPRQPRRPARHCVECGDHLKGRYRDE